MYGHRTCSTNIFSAGPLYFWIPDCLAEQTSQASKANPSLLARNDKAIYFFYKLYFSPSWTIHWALPFRKNNPFSLENSSNSSFSVKGSLKDFIKLLLPLFKLVAFPRKLLYFIKPLGVCLNVRLLR